MDSPGFVKPTHGYGQPFGELEFSPGLSSAEPEELMACPCGRGEYELCEDCPYETCSVHGSGEWAGAGFTKEPGASEEDRPACYRSVIGALVHGPGCVCEWGG